MKKILLLLMALLATTTVWAENYITDVMVIGGSKSEVNSLKDSYTDAGWTVIDKDLNDGCGSSSDYIYLLYKKARNTNQDAGAFITDFYISTSSGTAPDMFVRNGRIYHLVSCDGSTYFKNSKGDLNSHCGSSSAYLHLTTLQIAKFIIAQLPCLPSSSTPLRPMRCARILLRQPATSTKALVAITSTCTPIRPRKDGYLI